MINNKTIEILKSKTPIKVEYKLKLDGYYDVKSYIPFDENEIAVINYRVKNAPELNLNDLIVLDRGSSLVTLTLERIK